MAGLAAPLFGIAAGWLVGVYTTSTPTAPYLWFAAGVISWWLVGRQNAATSVPDTAAPSVPYAGFAVGQQRIGPPTQLPSA